jgi:hypothetical protein
MPRMKKSDQEMFTDDQRQQLAKTLVMAAFRNGKTEGVHAGQACPTCFGKPEFSHVSEDEMKAIMKDAVNRVYSLLYWLDNDQERLFKVLDFHARMTSRWDDPEILDLF